MKEKPKYMLGCRNKKCIDYGECTHSEIHLRDENCEGDYTDCPHCKEIKIENFITNKDVMI